ncbi:MAG: c-type cytochrome [Candidatus Eiseniibacteriota bacterium]
MVRLLLTVLVVLVAIVAGIVGWVYFGTESGAKRTYDLATAAPAIPSDSASIERGKHMAHAIAACAFCHGANLAGQVYMDEQPIARLVPANLTGGRGGVAASMTDEGWVNAIRHGVGRDKQTLLMMPSEVYQAMADDDLGALIAYLRSLPPVDNELPQSQLYPVGRALVAFGQAPFFTAEHVDHDMKPPATVERGVNAQFGYYLARMGGCVGCHGNDLAGRRVPGTPEEIPAAANITRTGIGHYKEEDFIRALHEGKRPGGAPINPFMPLTSTAQLTDDEIRAIFAYLRSIPPRDFGQNTSPHAVPPGSGS